MPDYTLIKPLCEELGITINELLSGEKIKEEEYQNKFEENILNTINHTNSKINKTKIIFYSILGVIILILSILFVFFGVDIKRMNNNENVIFSTWGFDYYPPINLDEENIEKTIKDYLISLEEQNKHYDNGKTFISMNIYLISEKSNKTLVYAWIMEEAYYKENNEIKQDSGSSIPYKIELSKENGKYIVTNYEIPRDGSYYARDMKYLFPNSVLKEMNNVYKDGTIEKLEFSIKEQVKLYFHE